RRGCRKPVPMADSGLVAATGVRPAATAPRAGEIPITGITQKAGAVRPPDLPRKGVADLRGTWTILPAIRMPFCPPPRQSSKLDEKATMRAATHDSRQTEKAAYHDVKRTSKAASRTSERELERDSEREKKLENKVETRAVRRTIKEDDTEAEAASRHTDLAGKQHDKAPEGRHETEKTGDKKEVHAIKQDLTKREKPINSGQPSNQ